MAKQLVAIVGPTATGKTALALELAQRLPGAVIVSAAGRKLDYAFGAVLTNAAEVSALDRLTFGGSTCIRIPRSILSALVIDIDDIAMRPIPGEMNTLPLLIGYANPLLTDAPLASPPELRHLVVSQITDLVALTLGATRDAAHIAEGRGVPAARLHAAAFVKAATSKRSRSQRWRSNACDDASITAMRQPLSTARRIAAEIVAARPVRSTGELVEAVKRGIPAAARRRGGHPARRTFQAIRMEVNRELPSLEAGLDESVHLLKPEGRVVVLALRQPHGPCGALFRAYWQPALLSTELPEPDCPPVRVRILGEERVRALVAQTFHVEAAGGLMSSQVPRPSRRHSSTAETPRSSCDSSKSRVEAASRSRHRIACASPQPRKRSGKALSALLHGHSERIAHRKGPHAAPAR